MLKAGSKGARHYGKCLKDHHVSFTSVSRKGFKKNKLSAVTGSNFKLTKRTGCQRLLNTT